jgi:hypothetical protein
MAEEKKGSLCPDWIEDDKWEYDFGPAEYTGEIASPHINSILDGIMKEAFPQGRTAAQEKQQKTDK